MQSQLKLSLLCFCLWLCGGHSQLSPPEAAIHHPDCPSTNDTHFLAYPNSCTKYYSCQQGFAFAMTCPHDLQWNPLTAQCDYADIVKCQDSQTSNTTPTPTPTMPTTQPPTQPTFTTNPQPPLPSIQPPFFQGDQYDCRRYYRCVEAQCPEHYSWDMNKNRCVLGTPANCVTGSLPAKSTVQLEPPTAATPVPSPTSTPSSAVMYASKDDPELIALCQAAKQNYIKHPNDCHKFVQCQGTAYEVTCPSNLYWNSELSACDMACI